MDTEQAVGDKPVASVIEWVSAVAGRPVEIPVLRGVEDVPAARAWTLEVMPHPDPGAPDGVEVIEDVVVRAHGRPLSGEIYRPTAPSGKPALLFLHGGAWCFGQARDCRVPGYAFARAGHTVLSLDYALAPEDPYPAGLEDVL